MTKKELRSSLIKSLKTQGFYVNGHIVPAELSKIHYKKIQEHSRIEQIKLQKPFLTNNADVIKKYLKNANDINPYKIKLELRVVKEGSEEEILYRWWNLIWWSIPYQKAYGRQMRFIIWDTEHNAPFGLIGLQSPILKMSVRDNYLKIPTKNLDYVINKSMQAQRLGALPPYNDIIGGKMVAMALCSNELRLEYIKKYEDVKTILKERVIEPDLLFITTTSAFGRSSIYNRLKFKNEIIAHSLGYTKGSGTFHVSEELYIEVTKFLRKNNIDVNTTFGYGPSRKMKLLDKAFSLMDLREYHYHNIHREFFIFPLVENLDCVIKKDDRPIFHQRSLAELTEFWIERWASKRAQSKDFWSDFNYLEHFKDIEKHLEVNFNFT